MTATGALAGVRIGGLVHYRNIPYARAQRFEAPQAVSAWHGVRDATRHGPVCPQLLSPITRVMGKPSEAEQSEDCLTLSVTAPEARSEPRPVMVWLHGGAYLVGAASYDWYRPDALVGEGDVIVVNVNYRVGAFGYLRLAGVSPGNLGLLDQLAALRWVSENIAAFGGDPARVTVFGQSAGAHSVVALMAVPAARGLFRRAIAQSPHLGVGFVSQRRAERVASVLRRCLNGSGLRSASAAELLAATRRMQIRLAGPGSLKSVPPFGPIAGVEPLPEPAQLDMCRAVLDSEVDLVIGSTRYEMRAYFDLNPSITSIQRLPRIGPRVYQRLARAATQRVFEKPAQRLADARAQNGCGRVFLYRFDWEPDPSPFGACHTLDLPFTFGGAGWTHAPMLGQTPTEQIERLGHELRTAWTHFARTGDPNAPKTPYWQPHRPGSAPARRFFSDPLP